MPRRTRLKRNTQKAKHLKRPRSWHRTNKVPLTKVMLEVLEIKREQREAERLLYDFCRYIKCKIREEIDRKAEFNGEAYCPYCKAFQFNDYLMERKEAG